MSEFNKLLEENVDLDSSCNLCEESKLSVGDSSGYGMIICQVGSEKDGWYATLSPVTGSDPSKDFTIMLMPFLHLTHFSQMSGKIAENYGTIFSKVSKAMTEVMMENEPLNSVAETREDAVSIATYGKATTWKEKKEHLHLKVFPFRGAIGQPYTVDSTFGKKEVHSEDSGDFVKMDPVVKKEIPKDRFDSLSKRLIELLK